MQALNNVVNTLQWLRVATFVLINESRNKFHVAISAVDRIVYLKDIREYIYVYILHNVHHYLDIWILTNKITVICL
jgi:hypothetical protein